MAANIRASNVVKGKRHIDEFWAFIALDRDGTEGLMGFSSGGLMMPAVAADRQRVESLRRIVTNYARLAGVQKLTLCKFLDRSDEEVIFDASADSK